MKIEKKRIDDTLTVALEGRLDTLTAPELLEQIDESLAGVKEVVYDFGKLEYISSAGLRVIVHTLKTVGKEGKVVIRGASGLVKSVFVVTSLDSLLTWE